MKTCTVCGIKKSYFDFYVRVQECRLRTDCKDCFDARGKVRYLETRPKQLAARKANYQINTARYNKQAAEWRAAHPEEMAAFKRKWKKLNRGKLNADWMKRHAAKLQATPKWLTNEQVADLERIYKACPKGFHVDHIIPLQGREVRGLHVPWNLQYLSAAENVRKGNRLEAA